MLGARRFKPYSWDRRRPSLLRAAKLVQHGLTLTCQDVRRWRHLSLVLLRASVRRGKCGVGAGYDRHESNVIQYVFVTDLTGGSTTAGTPIDNPERIGGTLPASMRTARPVRQKRFIRLLAQEATSFSAEPRPNRTPWITRMTTDALLIRACASVSARHYNTISSVTQSQIRSLCCAGGKEVGRKRDPGRPRRVSDDRSVAHSASAKTPTCITTRA